MHVKPEWTRALASKFGDEVRLSWNDEVGRWSFDILGVDGVHRPQFWQWQRHPLTGEKLKEDASGLLPFRDLNDESLREAIRNLERTYIGNPYDGHGTVHQRNDAIRRHNANLGAKNDRQNRSNSIDFFKEHHRKLTGGLQIQVVSPIGSKEG